MCLTDITLRNMDGTVKGKDILNMSKVAFTATYVYVSVKSLQAL